MKVPRVARQALEVELRRLAEEQVVEIVLDELGDLVRTPEIDPFVARRGPSRSGIEDLVDTLAAARDLPDDLRVRAAIPADRPAGRTVADAEAALHRQAAYEATVAWREAIAVRNTGRKQLVPGLLVALVAWVAAYGAAYAASEAGVSAMGALLAVVGVLAITVAWVFSWMVVETAFIDWRPAGRRAAAYDLLSRATLEVVTR